MKRIGLYVHSNIIDKVFFDELLYNLRPAAVCVQLYGVADLFDLFAKRNKILPNGWFSTGNNNTVYKPLSFF